MSYLGLALVPEGPSDPRFLAPLLHRLTEQICLQHGRAPVDVAGVVTLALESASADDRAGRIVAAAHKSRGSFHLLFLHSDGDGDPVAARNERCDRWADALRTAGLGNERTVAVVPVRETEAWALCDGDALRRAFGSTLTDRQLGVPERPERVERLSDPKRTLQTAYELACRPRRSRRSAVEMLTVIAERTRLEVLRQVPAFMALERE